MSTYPILQIDRSLTRSLRLFDQDRFRWLDEAASLGPLTILKVGPAKVWVTTDPEFVRAILVTEASSWRRPPSAVVPIRLGVGENLFTQSDKNWAAIQPMLSPTFRRKALASRLNELPTVIEGATCDVVLGVSTDLESLTNRIALIVAAWVLFGEELSNDRADDLSNHQHEVTKWVGVRLGQTRSILPLALGKSGARMKAHRAALDAYAAEVIERGRDRTNFPDGLLAGLLAARPHGKPLDAKALRGHVLGMLLAGNETTAAALAWALVHGAQNPIDWANLRRDPAFAEPFCAETLRLTPAVWGFARSPNRTTSISIGEGSARIRSTEVVTFYLRGMNRSPQKWTDPTKFLPSRHNNLTSEQQRSLLPFGLGPRSCIGQHLALAELHATLPVLARIGDVEIDREPRENPAFALRFRDELTGRFVQAAIHSGDAPI